jgi:hypothetical protein
MMSSQNKGRVDENIVAALYNTCFKQLNSVLAHLDLDELSVCVVSRLSIQNLRYLLWGESIGLVHRDSETERRPNHKLGDSIQQFKLSNVLRNFSLDLNNLKGIGLDYSSLRVRRKDTSRASKIFDRTFGQFEGHLATQNQEVWITGPRWIIYDSEDFVATIVQKMLELVDELEKITTVTEAIKVQHARIRVEIMMISNLDHLRLIRDAASGWHPYIHESAIDRLASITDVTEEMFPLTWTDSIATTMRGQSIHASDYSSIDLSNSTFRNNLLRGFAVARSAVPSFHLARPRRQSKTDTEEEIKNENLIIPEKYSEWKRHKIVVLGDECVGKTSLTTMVPYFLNLP